MEDVKVTFFSITEFGFFRRGADAPLFGDMDRVLHDLQRWTRGKILSHTKTYESGDAGLLPAFFLNVHRQGTDWLLSLWNEMETVDGAVASISGNDPVGEANVTLNELADGDIPGFATYFWFIPDLNVVATVRLNHVSAGRSQMRQYLYRFMAHHSSYVVRDDDVEDEIRILGYRDNNDGDIVRARPRFNMELFPRTQEQQALIARADRVRRIKKKAVLELPNRVDRTLWQKLLEAAHLDEPDARPHEVKIAYEVEVEGLEPDEIRNIIDSWEDENDETDYGFVMVGDPETYWLGRAIAKDDFQIDVRRDGPALAQPEHLLRELRRHRARLIAMLE